MKKYIIALLLSFIQPSMADSYSGGPTVRKILLAQDSLSVTIDDMIELQVLGYGLLIRSVDNGAEAKWLRLSEDNIKLAGDKISGLDPHIKFGTGIEKLLKTGGAKRPVFLFLQFKKIDYNEAFAIGGWTYNEAEADPLNKIYSIKFIRRDGSRWEVLKLLEETEDNLYPYLKAK
jgi:hypothetical protein